MAAKNEFVLVLGATGQQGGATARALRRDGWRVRAFVRDPQSPQAQALAQLGVELAQGDLDDRSSLDRAMGGAFGVFSIQPSSGQPQYGVSDEDELRLGVSVADAAKSAGVAHFVYTSAAGLRPGTGVGHFESKWRIEEHVRASGLRATIVRPAAFTDLLLWPVFGLSRRELVFFQQPDRAMQFIVPEDIGPLVAHVFSNPEAHLGATIELAGDELTGNELAAQISRATHESVSYARFPPEMLAQNPLFGRLVDVVDREKVFGRADIPALRRIHPGLRTVSTWLAQGGAEAIRALFTV
ncbi:NmrA/HSCARG family protein [Pendulispora albinea]|uniref:NmrA/HSCARG family protein n=1 Tax=Pendulispora albinea TaxID=2741071 RepID=A0ABZ2LZ59_9BACT